MVNKNIQGPVNLEGRGFVAKPRGDYQPGEFKRMSNMELKEGRLINRRNILGPSINSQSSDSQAPYPSDDLVFLGFHGHYNLYAGIEYDYQIGVDNNYDRLRMFNPSDLFDQEEYSKYEGFPVGFFQYNKKSHWIYMTWSAKRTSDSALINDSIDIGYMGIRVFSAPEHLDGGLSYQASELSLGTHSSIERNILDDDWLDFKMNSFFLFKDRLWILTPHSLVFSAATQPDNFSIDAGGGFFNFNDEYVNHAFAVKDSIYILTDNKVYVLTYQDDPNLDAVMREITNQMGGSCGTVHRETPFFMNKEGIFQINNQYVEKVADSHFDYGINNFNYECLISAENNLIVNKSYLVSDSVNPRDNEDGYYYARKNYFGYGSIENLKGLSQDASPVFFNKGSIVSRVEKTEVHSGAVSLSAYIETYHPSEERMLFRNDADGPNNIGRIPTSTNRVYCVSTYFKAHPDFDGRPFSILITFRDGSGEVTDKVEATVLSTSSINTTSSSTWRRFYLTFRIDKTDTYVDDSYTVSAGFIIGGTIGALESTVGYFDDMLFEEHIDRSLTPKPMFDVINVNDTDLDRHGAYGLYPEDRLRSWNAVTFIYRPTLLYYKTLRNSMEGSPSDGNSLGYNTYMINTDNGSTSVLDYKPGYNAYKTSDDKRGGFIKHLVYNPNTHPENGTSSLFILAVIPEYENEFFSKSSYTLFMDQDNQNNLVFDCIQDFDQFNESMTRYTYPYTDLEVSSFVPDGNEYLMKKFRNLEIMGKFPEDLFKVEVAFDNQPYADGIDLTDEPTMGYLRPHYPHRIGINQRARSISIRLRIPPEDMVVFLGPLIGDFFTEISDIRTLWSYTQYASRYAAGTSASGNKF